ncbi:Antifungal protein ginkbilobin-like protein [Linum grandiflorum]
MAATSLIIVVTQILVMMISLSGNLVEADYDWTLKDFRCTQMPDRSDGGPYAWGGSSCTDRITKSDCTDCLTYARGKMTTECPYRSGAYIVLADCSMRYDNYAFCSSQ